MLSEATTNKSTSAAGGETPLQKDWFTIWFMIVCHVIGIVGASLYFSWGAVIACVVLYFLTGMIGITLGYHRLLTHRAFKTSKFMERALATVGTLALQGTALEWVGHHRMHHAGSDTPKDPHNARKGFWWSHCGWLFYTEPQFDDDKRLRKFARDIVADPYMNFISQDWVMVAMQVALGLGLLVFGGIDYVMWGIFLRLVIVYHVTWFVNSLTHYAGYTNFESDDLAKNNWFVALVSFGEGWHNNHHANPSWAPSGIRAWEFDLTFQIIKVLEKLGLIWDVNRPQAHELVFNGQVNPRAVAVNE